MERPFDLWRRHLLVLALMATVALAAAAPAQASLRGWGHARFDSRAFALPAADVAIAQGATAVLRADGRVFVQGATLVPDGPPPPAGDAYQRIVLTDSRFAFGLLRSGGIVSWSDQGPGLPAPALPPGVAYVSIAAGYDHAVALRSDGVAVAWGSSGGSHTVVPASPPGVTVTQALAAGVWSMLLRSDGLLVPFGSNVAGQLNVPALPPGQTYTEAWMSAFTGAARRSDGVIVTWGYNLSGQATLPALPAGTVWSTLAFGSAHGVGLRSDGVVLAWGDNSYGQTDVPSLPAGQVVQLLAAGLHATVRLANGEVVGWGSAAYAAPLPSPSAGERWTAVTSGSGGHGVTSGGRILPLTGALPAPALPPGLSYTAVSGSYGHVVALRSDGRAVAWGDNGHGQCAIPPLPPGMSYTAIDTSFGRTVLLRTDGMVAECGLYGAVTIPPPPPAVRYEAVSCHSDGSMMLRSDGAITVVGGQDRRQQNVPPLPPGRIWLAVAMSRTFCAALRSDGEVVLWGTTPRVALPPLPAGVVYVQIDAQYDALLARRSDGRVVVAALASYDPLAVVPVPEPGESFVDVAVDYGEAIVRVGPTSTYVTVASGCAGSRPVSRLVPHDTPGIGRSLRMTVSELPEDIAVLVSGWAGIPPLPLASLGMPGCHLHVTADAFLLLAGSAGEARLTIAVPNAAALVGLAFHQQALVFDRGVNAAGAVVSDAAVGVVGNW